MYTLETLRPLNVVFDEVHRLCQDNVDVANDYVQLIESTRKDVPVIGDIIEYTDEYGNYSHNAHIESFVADENRFTGCAQPHVPFVYHNDDKIIGFNTGGGAWFSITQEELTYVGKREKMFMVFGNTYTPAHSGIYFKATVNVWRYTSPQQKYPGYTTKDWRREYISYSEKDMDGTGYHYFGTNIAFRNEADLQAWSKSYKAVEFKDKHSEQRVYFLYREQDVLISRKEWDALDLPLDTRQVNGVIHVKVAYDDDAHVVTTYRFTNSGYLSDKPYARARGIKLFAPGPEVKEALLYTGR